MSCRSYDKPYGADEALKARIEDAADLSAVRKAPCFVGFLDERQADLSSKIARNLGVQGFMLWEAMKTPSGVCSLPFQKNCYRTASAFRLFLFTSLFERRIPSATGIFLGR